MNHLYPIYLKAEQLNLLIVGGKEVAEEKLVSVTANSPGAGITVVARNFSKNVLRFKNVEFIQKEFEESDLFDKQLVIAATRNRELNLYVSNLARKNNILVNAADMPELCDFYLSSVIQKGDLKIAFSTNGKSPILARRLKEFFNDVIPDDIDELIRNIHEMRKELKGSFKEKVEIMNEITRDLKI